LRSIVIQYIPRYRAKYNLRQKHNNTGFFTKNKASMLCNEKQSKQMKVEAEIAFGNFHMRGRGRDGLWLPSQERKRQRWQCNTSLYNA